MHLNDSLLIEIFDIFSQYYNKAFISIFASEYENYPLVGIEAMACGSIVLASDIKGFREYVVKHLNEKMIIIRF